MDDPLFAFHLHLNHHLRTLARLEKGNLEINHHEEKENHFD